MGKHIRCNKCGWNGVISIYSYSCPNCRSANITNMAKNRNKLTKKPRRK